MTMMDSYLFLRDPFSWLNLTPLSLFCCMALLSRNHEGRFNHNPHFGEYGFIQRRTTMWASYPAPASAWT
jgi:hypothetical protein